MDHFIIHTLVMTVGMLMKEDKVDNIITEIDPSQKKCRWCNTFKDLENFSMVRPHNRVLSNVCNKCKTDLPDKKEDEFE